jgi:hypothetical protein
MAYFDQDHVITCPGIILWDGISTPNIDEKDGSLTHSLKIAIPENAPEKVELEQIAMAALQAHPTFKGQFPAGGEWPLRPIDMTKFGDSAPMLYGRIAINGNTRNGVPSIYDVNGQQLSAMQFGRMLYPGAVVKLLLHCYSFNNKSKGLAFGLDGVMIVDATAPKLDVGGGLSQSQVAAAFGARPGVPPMGGVPPAAGGAAPAPFVQPAPSAAAPGMPPMMVSGIPAPGAGPAPTFPSSPHTAFVANAAAPAAPIPAARQMTAKAGGHSYEQLVATGWTDATLREHGYML